jgi:Uncharacterized enzyme of thiazole biosynthesis
MQMTAPQTADALTLYGETFASRVLLGTSRYPSLQSLSDSIDAAQPGMVTVALRRQMNEGGAEAGFFDCSSATACRCCPIPPAA